MIDNTEQRHDDMQSSPQWFAVYTTPRHEKHVSDALTDRQVETFLPLYRTKRQWKKRKQVTLELPLFPSYLFIRIVRQDRGQVLAVPGVLSIVGSATEPWPLCDFEIETLRSGLHLRNIEPHPYLLVGEQVRIKCGPLCGMKGMLVRTKSNLRVILTLDCIMRSISVEVDYKDLEAIDATKDDPVMSSAYILDSTVDTEESQAKRSYSARSIS